MAKAYDRVHWSFLLEVLRRMGFSQNWVSLIERCIYSNWFSIMINGKPGGFFKSTRGLRQGDPLSPALFTIAADYLSRTLDKLILGNKEREYRTTRRGLGISHLAYADDDLIFTKASENAIQGVMDCLQHYTAVSGQMVNIQKSHFFLDPKHAAWAEQIRTQSDFQQGLFPVMYLGVPIYKGGQKVIHVFVLKG